MSAPQVYFTQVTSVGARDPKVQAEVDGVKVTWKVRAASRDGRYPRLVGWYCTDHGPQRDYETLCSHAVAAESHLSETVMDRLDAVERRRS